MIKVYSKENAKPTDMEHKFLLYSTQAHLHNPTLLELLRKQQASAVKLFCSRIIHSTLSPCLIITAPMTSLNWLECGCVGPHRY